MHKDFRGGGVSGSRMGGSKVRFWGSFLYVYVLFRDLIQRPEMAGSSIVTKNTEKNTSRHERNAGNSRKHPAKNGHFWYFVFWRCFLGVQNFVSGGILFGIFVDIPGSAISGLCSKPGRSYLSLAAILILIQILRHCLKPPAKLL